MLPKITLCLSFLFLFSCSQEPTYKEAYQSYIAKVEQNHRVMQPDQFRLFLNKELAQKESHLAVMREYYQKEGDSEGAHQSGGYGTTDIQQLNVRNSQIKLHDMADKIKILEKEVFFLKSKLSLFK